jgi:hypothetical protein
MAFEVYGDLFLYRTLPGGATVAVWVHTTPALERGPDSGTERALGSREQASRMEAL